MHRAGALVLLGVECPAHLDPNRPERRAPADACAYRVAEIGQIEPLLAGKGITDVTKYHALQVQLLHQRKGDFVVQYQLFAPTDRTEIGLRLHACGGVWVVYQNGNRFARSQATFAKPANRVDATREVAVKQWQVVVENLSTPCPVGVGLSKVDIADPVAEKSSSHPGKCPPGRAVIDGEEEARF